MPRKGSRKGSSQALRASIRGVSSKAHQGKVKRDEAAVKLVAERAKRAPDAATEAKIMERARKDLEERKIPGTMKAMRLASTLARLDAEMQRGRGNLGVLAKQITRYEEQLDAVGKDAAE